jgi:hypothetical protein
VTVNLPVTFHYVVENLHYAALRGYGPRLITRGVFGRVGARGAIRASQGDITDCACPKGRRRQRLRQSR